MKLKRNEKVKDVNGYEGLYAITSLGRVWSYRRNKWLKHCVDGPGYLFVTLCIKGKEADKKVHRLVGDAFVPNPDNKPQINHKNGNKKDCKSSNLEWVTARENLQHACDMGLNKCFKLSYEDRVLACQLYWDHGLKQNKIAKMFDVTPPAINYVIKTYTTIIATNHSL